MEVIPNNLNKTSTLLDIDTESSENKQKELEQIVDKGCVILLISFIYGVATISPWNAIVSTLDFFDSEIPDYPINFFISFAINFVMVISVIFCIALSSYTS